MNARNGCLSSGEVRLGIERLEHLLGDDWGPQTTEEVHGVCVMSPNSDKFQETLHITIFKLSSR